MIFHRLLQKNGLPLCRPGAGIISLLFCLLITFQPAAGEITGLDTSAFFITVTDSRTGAALEGAMIYPDGKLAGVTPADGTFILKNTSGRPRSVRVTRGGYRENTTAGGWRDNSTRLLVMLTPSPVQRLLGPESPDTTLDIVFAASNTSYDCTARTKIPDPRYVGNRDAFVSDVRRLSEDDLLQLGRFTRSPAGIPENYPRRVAVWYYWDESRYADAFRGCSGTLPQSFWDDAPFADVAVILYPAYTGRYTGDPCEPQGCSNGAGPGLQSQFKVPAHADRMFMHESGHAIFGLMDTYCGDTYYAENQPYPNIWSSGSGCRSDMAKNGLNASLCRPFTNESPAVPATCGKGFYKYDPAPDLMGSTAAMARFGDASVLHIRYVLDRFPGG